MERFLTVNHRSDEQNVELEAQNDGVSRLKALDRPVNI